MMTIAAGGFPRDKVLERLGRKVNLSLLGAITATIPVGYSIIDLGAGDGRYVRALRAIGYKTDGVDGGEDVEGLTGCLVKWADLTDCPSLCGAADWALFLEVGEHVPRKHEDDLFRNVSNVPKVGLVVTWATTRRGFGHVNRRSPLYVANRFGAFGWVVDEKRTRRAKKDLDRLYRDRIMVLVR